MFVIIHLLAVVFSDDGSVKLHVYFYLVLYVYSHIKFRLRVCVLNVPVNTLHAYAATLFALFTYVAC